MPCPSSPDWILSHLVSQQQCPVAESYCHFLMVRSMDFLVFRYGSPIKQIRLSKFSLGNMIIGYNVQPKGEGTERALNRVRNTDKHTKIKQVVRVIAVPAFE